MKDDLISFLVGAATLTIIFSIIIGFIALVFKWPWIIFLLLIPWVLFVAYIVGEIVRDDYFNR